MHTKRSKITNVIVISLLVLTTIISVGFYLSRPQTVASANNEPAQQAQALPGASIEKPAETSIQQSASQDVLSKTQNDITVKITSAKVISTGVEIGVCYTAPDNGEWRPMPGHLFYGEHEVLPDEIEFLDNEMVADGKNTGTRCALIRYRIDDLNILTTPVEFSILRFYAPSREMYTPCQELQQRLATNPKAKAYGLKAKCTETGDGNISVMLADHSRSIANEKASKVLDEIAKAEVAGTWEFTINDIER